MHAYSMARSGSAPSQVQLPNFEQTRLTSAHALPYTTTHNIDSDAKANA
jgi:hypothetical protein